MAEITEEMRQKLRKPLPSEAVSPHPTKSYLSSIKSIYVAERISNVFGLGSWTLKSSIEERIDKFVVVKAILEIPQYGFYGEAYGGNDNADIGDAYKGATTDAFTKISGQQLEIGIDVFKGLSGKTQQAKETQEPKSSQDQRARIFASAKEKGIEDSLLLATMIRKFSTGNTRELTKSEASELIQMIESGKIKPDEINPEDLPF